MGGKVIEKYFTFGRLAAVLSPAERRRSGAAEDWPSVEAQVPGNVELDLVRAGLEEDPFWGENLYNFRRYEFYQWWLVHFISECGYHGCPPVSSLKKYIPEDRLTPWLNNCVWDTHNTDYLLSGKRGYNRIQLMHDQVDLYFGRVPEDLKTFSKLSQVVQE